MQKRRSVSVGVSVVAVVAITVRRDALGRAAFEGLGILPDGTSYMAEDDSGLGPKNGGPGNMFFKFVPSTPFTGSGPITDLAQSPYAAGRVRAAGGNKRHELRAGP